METPSCTPVLLSFSSAYYLFLPRKTMGWIAAQLCCIQLCALCIDSPLSDCVVVLFVCMCGDHTRGV